MLLNIASNKLHYMPNQIEITAAGNSAREKIIALLLAEKLPVEDLPASLDNFFVAVDNDTIVGAVGMEQYDNYALLRSLVVDKDYRGKSIANNLLAELEQHASAHGVSDVYLLTETAPTYFAKKEYTKVTREEVPQAVQASSEFSHVCPVSAVVMKKSLLQTV